MTARRLADILVIACLVPLVPLAAQSVRISGATSFRYIELRPFIRDSVPMDATDGSGLLRQLSDGRVVRCIPGEDFCRDTRPGDVVSTVPVIHDVEVSAWGFGKGIRLFSHLRGRTSLGGNRDLWPRAEDAVDVLALYGELERDRFRVRAGRQWKVSGLGFYNFDGVAVAVRPSPTTWVEAYAGRSLVRGLNEARTGGALESIEPLSAPNSGILAGLHARYRPTANLALSAQYQVDLRGDRAGIYSELALADGVLRLGGGSVEGSVEIDAATSTLNQARLAVRSAPFGKTVLFVEARRYRPYFELWTIWGAFSPVGFDEGRGGVTWADRGGHLILRGEASYRSYESTGVEESVDAYRTSGWGLGGSVTWLPDPPWRLEASYRVESGFGASRWDSQAGVRREFGNAGSITVQGVGFQRLYEFRLGEGTVAGIGAEGSLPLGDRARVFASLMAYRQYGGTESVMDWNQRRGSVRLEWVLGREPESLRRSGGRP